MNESSISYKMEGHTLQNSSLIQVSSDSILKSTFFINRKWRKQSRRRDWRYLKGSWHFAGWVEKTVWVFYIVLSIDYQPSFLSLWLSLICGDNFPFAQCRKSMRHLITWLFISLCFYFGWNIIFQTNNQIVVVNWNWKNWKKLFVELFLCQIWQKIYFGTPPFLNFGGNLIWCIVDFFKVWVVTLFWRKLLQFWYTYILFDLYFCFCIPLLASAQVSTQRCQPYLDCTKNISWVTIGS